MAGRNSPFSAQGAGLPDLADSHRLVGYGAGMLLEHRSVSHIRPKLSGQADPHRLKTAGQPEREPVLHVEARSLPDASREETNMSDLFDTDLHELRDLADLVDHTDRTVDEILLAEAFNSGELHTYIDGKGQVALRVCARWERVRELFDSLQVKDPNSVYTVMVHLGWRSTDPIFAQSGDDSISEHDQAEHDAVMAELHDLADGSYVVRDLSDLAELERSADAEVRCPACGITAPPAPQHPDDLAPGLPFDCPPFCSLGCKDYVSDELEDLCDRVVQIRTTYNQIFAPPHGKGPE